MKQQPSAIAMTSLSGHSGGTTATITNIVRRKSNPRQPRTSAQSAARSILGYLSQLWGALTTVQQDAWIAAAPNKIKVKNGVAVPLKGNTYFIEINTNILTAGGDVISLPPTPVALPDFPEFWFWQTDYSTGGGFPSGDFQITAPYQDLPTDPWIAIYYWAKWKGPGIFSIGKPATIIPTAFTGSGVGVLSFSWDSFGDVIPAPPGEFYKSNTAVVFINKNTGQRWTLFAGRFINTTYVSYTAPYQAQSNIDTHSTTGTPPNLTTTVNLITAGDNYDFATWEPEWKMSEWVTSGDQFSAIVNIDIPETAFTSVTGTSATLTFGPTAGEALHPTATGLVTHIVSGWRNTTTGEFSLDRSFDVTS